MTYGVLTISLNSAGTIARTIDSVLSQTLTPAEYVFVDGGSTDGTVEIIREKQREYVSDGGRIEFKLIDQGSERGITPAWNLGLAQMTADVIFILNSDDWYTPDCAWAVMSAMAADSRIEIVQASMATYRPGATTSVGVENLRPAFMMPVLMAFVHPACFVRRGVYERLGNFDCRYRIAADYEFLYRCLKGGVSISRLDKVLVNFQLGGCANQSRREARLEMFHIARKYCRVPFLPHIVLLLRSILSR